MRTFDFDITGLFRERAEFGDRVFVREPDVEDGKRKTFYASLILPERKEYSFTLLYEPLTDRLPFRTLGGSTSGFKGFTVNGVCTALDFLPVSEDAYAAKFTAYIEERAEITLSVVNTRPLKCIVEEVPEQDGTCFYSVLPECEPKFCCAHGVPFALREIVHRFQMPGYNKIFAPILGKESGTLFSGRNTLKFRPVKANKIHFLGMIHSLDIANGSWYSDKGDHSYSHFCGDKAGDLIIMSSAGKRIKIPLIFGVNIWYCSPYDMVWHYQDNPYTPGQPAQNFDSAIFGGEDAYRDVISDSLALCDAAKYTANWYNSVRYKFTVELSGEEIVSVTLRPAKGLTEFPVISAVTIEGRGESGGGLLPLPDISRVKDNAAAFAPGYFERKEYLPNLDRLKKLLYTYVSERPRLVNPQKPEGYFGPEYDFRGAQGVYAATYLYHNGPECASHIGDVGTGCSSSTCGLALHHYVHGYGMWIDRGSLYDGLADFLVKYREKMPGELGGSGNAWTRGAGELLREAAAFGYGKFLNSYIAWLDNCLVTESNPPHFSRIAGVPTEDKRMVGEVEERGNRENDGHGICMMGRYMAWYKSGMDIDWAIKNYPATKACVDWIKWQLDTDTIYPGVRKDVLFSDSECAHWDYDFYSSFNPLHGLRLTILMAQRIGKTEDIPEYTELYNRLAAGILEHLTVDTPMGKIWFTEEQTDWQDHAHKLAHLQLATDGVTFTPREDYREGTDKEYLDIDINSYRWLMRNKDYNSLRMYGYGQGFLAQAALLLDELNDAEKFIDLMLKYCYLPKFGDWISPEGIICHKSMKYYIAVNNYMGQDSHLADSTKAIRIMLGVDDNNPQRLRLVPRFFKSYKSASFKRFPAVINGKTGHVDFSVKRTKTKDYYSFALSDRTQVALRLGPLTGQPESLYLNGRELKKFDIIKSGDSEFVWTEFPDANEGEAVVCYKRH